MKKGRKNSAFAVYCKKVSQQYSSGEAREHAYRPALQEFVESFNAKLRVTNEPGKSSRGKLGDSQNRPDFIIVNAQTPVGFIEAKDIGIDLDEVGESEQIARYCAVFPNLILTNYLEFRRYTNGKLRGKPVRIGSNNKKKKEIKFNASGDAQLKQLFEEFLLEQVQSISSPQELANRLANLTRQIKKLVKQELDVEEDSIQLHKLMVAFKKVLLADLNTEKFADMFAQTLAYGFFAARVHYDGQGEFSRRTASTILPKTNPFLRRIFAEFANESLPDSLIEAVDEIVELLRKTDIKAVLNHFGEQNKQDPVVHFYESFLASYDPKLKKAMGVFYTPDPVVSYMVQSLDELLTNEFGRKKGLADDKTLILDPALGTGSYLHKVVSHIHGKIQPGSWDSYVGDNLLHRIFGFEILMAPYAVAHLNLGMQLQKTGYQFSREQRLGVYLTNTLEETAKRSEVLFSDWISEEAEAAADVKRQKAIMVVVGNPPYSGESQNDGPWIRDLLRGYDRLSHKKCANYFECEGKPLKEKQLKWLSDDYVKFIRFSHWRIEQTGHGILAFITNHGFLDNPTFRGMREALMRDFDSLYILDLHGNSKKREKARDGSPDENVFDIQQGVSICFMVRNESKDSIRLPANCNVYRADLYGDRASKYKWLERNSLASTKFNKVKPQSPSYYFTVQNHKLREEYETGIPLTSIFQESSVGVVTARDALTICYDQESTWKRVKDFISTSAEETREAFSLSKDARDWSVKNAQIDIKDSGPSKKYIQPILYRPFDTRFTYYTGKSKGFIGQPAFKVMRHMIEGDNLGIVSVRQVRSGNWKHCFITNCMVESSAVSNRTSEIGTLFPLYRNLDGAKKFNIHPEILDTLRKRYLIVKEEDIFNYIYALLFSESYRKRYSEFLGKDHPRIQFPSDVETFQSISSFGAELIQLHLLKNSKLEGGNALFSVKGTNVIERLRYDQRSNRLYINDAQYFENVYEAEWNYELGAYKPLEKWLKDRKGLKLDHNSIAQFEKIVESLRLTSKLVKEIDDKLESSSEWPLSSGSVSKVHSAA